MMTWRFAGLGIWATHPTKQKMVIFLGDGKHDMVLRFTHIENRILLT